MKQLSRDTNSSAENFLIELVRKKSVPQRLVFMQALSSLAINLSKNALKKANASMTNDERNLLFVKLNYGENLFKKLSEHIRKILDESK